MIRRIGRELRTRPDQFGLNIVSSQDAREDAQVEPHYRNRAVWVGRPVFDRRRRLAFLTCFISIETPSSRRQETVEAQSRALEKFVNPFAGSERRD